MDDQESFCLLFLELILNCKRFRKRFAIRPYAMWYVACRVHKFPSTESYEFARCSCSKKGQRQPWTKKTKNCQQLVNAQVH